MAMVFVVYVAALLVFYVPGYVLTGMSLYSIGKRRGIEQPWRAWVPVMNLWLIGCISDQYQAIVRGKQKYKRLVLLGLILGILLMFSLMVLTEPETTGNMTVFLLLFVPLWCAMAALIVITFMALYDLYVSCDPKHAVLYLILSIVFHVTQPVFLFLCRKKDLGFPL